MSVLQSKRRAIINEPHKATASGAVVQMDKAEYAPMGVVANFAPVQEGSGDPSPDNVRPISGWTGCNVYDDAKLGRLVDWNQLVPIPNSSISGSGSGVTLVDNRDGSYSFSGTGTATKTWTIKSNFTYTAGHKIAIIGMPNVIGLDIADSWSNMFTPRKSDGIITLDSTQKRIDLVFKTYNTFNQTTAVTVTPMWFDLTAMFGAGNEPSTVEEFKALFPHDYYPYTAGGTLMTVGQVNGEAYRAVNVNWQDTAGTVYGGTLDLATGVLTSKYGYVDLGTRNWTFLSAASWNCFSATIPGKKNGGDNFICSAYPYGPMFQTTTDKIACGNTGNNTLYIRDSSYTEATDFKTAMSGVYLAYELATPITYQLTPTQIKSLRGKNNVWTDMNGLTDVSAWVH